MTWVSSWGLCSPRSLIAFQGPDLPTLSHCGLGFHIEMGKETKHSSQSSRKWSRWREQVEVSARESDEKMVSIVRWVNTVSRAGSGKTDEWEEFWELRGLERKRWWSLTCEVTSVGEKRPSPLMRHVLGRLSLEGDGKANKQKYRAESWNSRAWVKPGILCCRSKMKQVRLLGRISLFWDETAEQL